MATEEMRKLAPRNERKGERVATERPGGEKGAAHKWADDKQGDHAPYRGRHCNEAEQRRITRATATREQRK